MLLNFADDLLVFYFSMRSMLPQQSFLSVFTLSFGIW